MTWGEFDSRATTIIVRYGNGPSDVYVRPRADDEDQRWGKGKDIRGGDDYFGGDDFHPRPGIVAADLIEGLRAVIEKD